MAGIGVVRPCWGEQHILPLAERIGRVEGTRTQTMIITAAFTGMRWGELAGLSVPNCRTDQHIIVVDPEVGALHEVGGRMWLGPPKSGAGARIIDLPPFLAGLLQQIVEGHDHEQVFVSREGRWLRRSNFSRRIWRPACDGTPHPGPEASDADEPVGAILPGAVFHGLRHLHKSVLLEAGIPRVLQYDRLGHELGGIEGVYSHVTPPMRNRLITELQHRWTTLTTSAPDRPS